MRMKTRFWTATCRYIPKPSTSAPYRAVKFSMAQAFHSRRSIAPTVKDSVATNGSKARLYKALNEKPQEKLFEQARMVHLSKYRFIVDLSNRDSSLTKIVELVGFNKNVLEVGCATGYMSKVMKERGCRVLGVESDEEAAQQAKEYCDRLVLGDVESIDMIAEFGDEKFDVAVFSDVLEHLKNPSAVLLRVKELLRDEGYIAISVPNIAHGTIRLKLLMGNFDYEPMGLLDETHLRFFTKRSIIDLVESCGYFIEQVDYVTREIPFELIQDAVHAMNLDEKGFEKVSTFLRHSDGVLYQVIVKGSKRSSSKYLEKLASDKSSLERNLREVKGQLIDKAEYARHLEKDIGVLRTAIEERDKRIQHLQSEVMENPFTRAFRICKNIRDLFTAKRKLSEA